MSILTDPEIRAILTMLGAWVSGLGSLAAAGVALWLGYRTGRIKLRIETTLIQGGLAIYVTNLSERPVVISHATWRVGKRGNRQWKPCPISSQEASDKLEYGDRQAYYITDIRSLKHVKTLRIRIYTSVGYTRKVVPPKAFLKKLEEAAKPKAC